MSDLIMFSHIQIYIMSLINKLRMDKTVFSIGTLEEQGDDREYWASKTPEERLQALEFMRQVMYGYDPDTPRLQRVFTIAKCAQR